MAGEGSPTGQRLDDSTSLLYYGARYYDPGLRLWVQPDSIVPNPGNPQDLNRYSAEDFLAIRDELMMDFGLEVFKP